MDEYDEVEAQREAATLQTPAIVERRQFVSELLGLQSGEMVLSVGCGPGFEPAALADSDGVVHAVDRSDTVLALAERYCSDLSNVTSRRVMLVRSPLRPRRSMRPPRFRCTSTWRMSKRRSPNSSGYSVPAAEQSSATLISTRSCGTLLTASA